MSDKSSAKPSAATGSPSVASPTTMAWSVTLASLKVSVKALKEHGGFGKIMEKVGLAMTESDLLYSKEDSAQVKTGGGFIEIDPQSMTDGMKKFTDKLASAGIDFDPKDVKYRIF